MESRAKAFGHPIHPMLIVFPLGLLATALGLDVAYAITERQALGIASYWNIAIGVVAGLLAAVFGLIDWLGIPAGTRAKRIGLLHGLGFAEALASLHLSRPEMLSALISFNAGVEGGQLAVIAIAALAMSATVRIRVGWRRPVVAVSSGAIGLIGLVWTIQRIW